MQEERIWNLIAKKISNEHTPEELRELEEALRENPELHYSMHAILHLWHTEEYFDRKDAQEAFLRHINKMRQLNLDYPKRQILSNDDRELTKPISDNRNKKAAVIIASASFIILAILVALNFLKPVARQANIVSPKQSSKAISEVSTKNGSKTNLILPDGTKVWMNAGSNLSYDSAYGKNIREVSLSGEAFFDVVKNKEKPFVIHASKINIKVLGTEFNVKSYPSDKTIEASLIRGSIEVTFRDKPNKKIILKPNEKIIVENNVRTESKIIRPSLQKEGNALDAAADIAITNLTYEHKTGAIIETSWVENNLIFQDQSFEEIAKLLERWYGVSIKFENNQLKENHLTGSFKNETIRQALDALKFTASFNYEINNNNITIY
jgi:ferric-dicitrate binding protein FerR (iron transport regulator)